jgi:hypothetical protein
MKKALRGLFGLVCLLLGVTLAAWIAYNLLVERLPATEGRNPLPAVGFAIGLFCVGMRQLRPADRSK